MGEITVPGATSATGASTASNDLGVTEPVPKRPLDADEKLAWRRPPSAVVPPPNRGYVLPSVIQDAWQRDRGQRLARAQETSVTLPDPDAAAALRGEAGARAIPFSVALADPKALEPKSPPISWDQYADNHPLSEILLDPTKAVLVKDEADRLARLAELDKDGFSKFRAGQMWESGSLGIERDNLWFSRGMNGGVSSPEDEARLQVVDSRLSLLPSAESTGGQVLEGIVQQGPRMLGMTKAGLGGAAAGGAVGIVAGPGGSAAMAGVGARVAVFAYNAESAIGNAYSEYAGLGLPHNVAWPVALITGGVVAGIDTLSFGLLAKIPALKALGGMKGIEALTKENVGPAVAAAMKDSRFVKLLGAVGKDMTTEGSTEMLQEIVQILGGYAGAAIAPGEYRTPTLEEAAGRTLMAGTVGAAVGGAFGGAGTIAHELTARVGAGEQSQVVIDHLYDQTEKLKSAERAPDILQKYGNELAKDGPVKYLTMPVEDLTALLDANAESPATKAWLARPETQRQLSEAGRTGARVAVPLGDFIAYIRPLDTNRTLNQVIGINDEMSPAEAKALKPAVQKARKEMADISKRKEALDNLPESQIIADLEKKLRAVGQTAEAAKMQAELVASGIATLARRSGKDPWETYRGAPLTISNFTHEQSFTKSLDQADPKGVERRRTGADEGMSGLMYEHPESPLQLRTYDQESEQQGAPGVVKGEKLRTVGLLGFSDKVQENIISVKQYGGQGYSTALYLSALMDAQQDKVGFASDTIRTDATDRMYARLQKLGIPFEMLKVVPEAGDRSADFFYLPHEKLAKLDLDAAWEKLQGQTKKEAGALAGATEAEVDALLGGLKELQQKQRGDVRGRITFDPAKRDWFAITLTGKANLSTFLHESSHYLLEIMRKLALENPESELISDLKVLEEWAGVKPGEEWSDAALEKFARGMETYFGEGKAPSAKLAAAFATFKTWILHVYRTLTNLGAPLTDEVRSVMDRMLATQQEIDTRRLELGYFPNDILIREGEMSAEEQQRYRNLYEKGAQQAQVALDREAIAAFRKEKTAEYKRISEGVEKDLDSHPTIALRAWLAGEGRPGGGLVPEAPPAKFDKELVPRHLQGKLKAYIADIGGADPEEVAPYFGFKNRTEMLESLAATPARSTLKSVMVKAEMTKLYPAYGPDKGWVEKAALEQLHEADAVSNALELELRTIYRKAKLAPPNSPALVAQQAARGAVAQMSREEMRPAVWRDAETRNLREQQKALAAKDFKTAAEATRRRLYSRAMWQEVQKAASKLDAAEKFVKRYASDDAQGRLGRSSGAKLPTGERVGSVVRDAVKALVEGVKLADASYASAEGTFDSYVTKLEEAGLPVSIDPVLRERPLRKWGELTYMEALSVQDAVKNLARVARDLNVIRLGEQAMDLDEIATQVEKNLQRTGLLNRLGQKGEQNSVLRHLRAETTKPETIVLDIDGGEPGIFHKLFVQSAEQGQFERDRRFRQRRADLQEIGKKYRPEDWYKLTHEKHQFLDGREYTGSQVFSMLLNFGSESNRDKLIRGMQKAGLNGWTEENVLRFIHEVFPRKDVYTYAQALLGYVSTSNLWEDAAAVREAIAGVRPEKVEALAIPTPDGGQIEGGYYPLVYDRKVPLKEAETSGLNALDAMEDSNPLNLYAANGFTRGRTGFAAPILLDPTALAAHIYEVDHFIANAQGIIDRHKLLQHPRVKKAIIHSLGFDYWEQLKLSNNFIAADGRMLTREVLQLTRGVEKLIYHNALLTMGGNILSGMNQVVNGVPAMLAYLGPRGVPAFAKALLSFAKNPFATWKAVSDASGEIEGMDFHYDRDLRLVVAREMTGESWDHVRSRIAATTMTPVVFGQKVVNVLTWKAAFDIAGRDGKSNEDAVAYANSVVRQSQSASAPKDFTAVQRSRDGLMRILTSLASYTFTLNDMVMPRRLTQREIVGHTARLAMLVMTSAMMKALFDAIFPLLEEKDAARRKGVEKMAADSEIPGLLGATEAMMDVVGNIPVVGRTAQAVLSGREPRYASWVETGIKALEAAPDALSDKGLGKRELRAVVESIGLAAGVPTRHLLFAPGEFIYEVMDGNVEDNPWSFFQELALVRPGQKGTK
jgi:hypothetical protein